MLAVFVEAGGPHLPTFLAIYRIHFIDEEKLERELEGKKYKKKNNSTYLTCFVSIYHSTARMQRN